MGSKPNWGRGLQSLGHDLGLYARQLQQQKDREAEREYQNNQWQSRFDAQQGAIDRRQAAGWARDDANTESDRAYAEAQNPIIDNLPTGRIGLPGMEVDLNLMNRGDPLRSQMSDIQGAGGVVRQDDLNPMVAAISRQLANKELAATRAANKAPAKPPRVSDEFAIKTVVDPRSEEIFPSLKPLTGAIYGQLLSTPDADGNYPQGGSGLMAFAEKLAMEKITETPFFGNTDRGERVSMSYDPVSGQMYDDRYSEPDPGRSDNKWLPGDNATPPGVKPLDEYKNNDFVKTLSSPELSLYFNDTILPEVRAGRVTWTQVQRWAKEKGVSGATISKLIDQAQGKPFDMGGEAGAPTSEEIPTFDTSAYD